MTTAQLTKPNTAVSVKLDSNDRERLNKIASMRKRTSHYLMKEAIQTYISHEEARLDFKRETDEAWQHYQETGLHITQDELFTWMDSMFTPNELTPPVCHK